eukprot:gene2096-4100_t
MGWWLFHRALWSVSENGPQKNVIADIETPDTVIFSNSTPLEWYYTPEGSSGVFRKYSEDVTLGSIFRTFQEKSKSLIIARMIWYNDKPGRMGTRLKIRYLNQDDLREILFVGEDLLPDIWMLQEFKVPGINGRVSTTVSESIGRRAFEVCKVVNRHEYRTNRSLGEAGLTVESVDPKHVETKRVSVRTRDRAIDVSEAAMACISNLVGRDLSQELMSFYFNGEQSETVCFMWGYWENREKVDVPDLRTKEPFERVKEVVVNVAAETVPGDPSSESNDIKCVQENIRESSEEVEEEKVQGEPETRDIGVKDDDVISPDNEDVVSPDTFSIAIASSRTMSGDGPRPSPASANANANGRVLSFHRKQVWTSLDAEDVPSTSTTNTTSKSMSVSRPRPPSGGRNRSASSSSSRQTSTHRQLIHADMSGGSETRKKSSDDTADIVQEMSDEDADAHLAWYESIGSRNISREKSITEQTLAGRESMQEEKNYTIPRMTERLLVLAQPRKLQEPNYHSNLSQTIRDISITIRSTSPDKVSSRLLELSKPRSVVERGSSRPSFPLRFSVNVATTEKMDRERCFKLARSVYEPQGSEVTGKDGGGNSTRDKSSAAAMNSKCAGSLALEWSKKFGDTGRRHKDAVVSASAVRIDTPNGSPERLVEIVNELVLSVGLSLRALLYRASALVEPPFEPSGLQTQPPGPFLVSKKGFGPRDDQWLMRMARGAGHAHNQRDRDRDSGVAGTKRKPGPGSTSSQKHKNKIKSKGRSQTTTGSQGLSDEEMAFSELVKVFTCVPHHRSPESVALTLLWAVQGCNPRLKKDTDLVFRTFGSFLLVSQETLSTISQLQSERGYKTQTEKDELLWRAMHSLQVWYLVPSPPPLTSASNTGRERLGQQSSTLYSRSTADTTGEASLRSSSNGAFRRRRPVSAGSVRRTNRSVATGSLSPEGVIQWTEVEPAVHIAMLQFLSCLNWERKDRTEVTSSSSPGKGGTIGKLDSFEESFDFRETTHPTTKSSSSSSDPTTTTATMPSYSASFYQSTFSQPVPSAQNWIKSLSDESVATYEGLPRQMNQRQREMVMMSIISDVIRVVLIHVYLFAQRSWGGAEVTLVALEAAFRPLLDIACPLIDRKLLMSLLAWYGTNRRTDISFSGTQFVHVELVMKRLYSFWPVLDMREIDMSSTSKPPAIMDVEDAGHIVTTSDVSKELRVLLVWPHVHKVVKAFREPSSMESSLINCM